MKIEDWYKDNFEIHLRGRYITLKKIFPLLDMYKMEYEISVIAVSELGKDIPMIKMGNGKKVILAWSQMHGNESTTTKAIFDLLKFLSQKKIFQKEISNFLNSHSLHIIPILNPDGAQDYTRENSNGVDLNRDAQNLTQSESKCLRNIFDALKPALCLNLHDQRSIYGLYNGLPATVSFLAPAANKSCSITPARKIAMEHIVKMNKTLQKYITKQIGRFDDTYNNACVGDTFQQLKAPTILIEAGHFENDYQREKTREFIFYSFLSLFGIIDTENTLDYKEYFDIPENQKNYRDFILRNVILNKSDKTVDVAVQYSEILKNNTIEFISVIDEIGNLSSLKGHREENAGGAEILTNSHEILKVGKNISKIINKYDKSTIYFQ